MKRIRNILIFIFLLFFINCCSFFRYNLSNDKEPKNFRKIEWGTDIGFLENMIFERENGGLSFYVKKNDKLSIGNVKIKKIEYGFYDGKFCSVQIHFNVQYRSTMSGILEAAYGKPNWENLLGVPNALWENENISIRHFYIGSEVGDVVMYNYKPIYWDQFKQDEKESFKKSVKDL